VAQSWGSGISSWAISKIGWLPYNWERDSVRWCDRTLGERAGRIATCKRTALLSYSYYAHSAFSNYCGIQPRILFQLHPHPVSVRAILQRERLLHADCAQSLEKEWELALPDRDFRRLVDESASADYWLAASQYTKQTLVDAGAPLERIAVIPYGVDAAKFVTAKSARSKFRPLQLLFVGTLGQRKGIKYLLQAIDLLPKGSVELTACGRAVDDLALFKKCSARVHLRPSINFQGLLEAYRTADVFVFPSLAEGFAHVLLEAMASGLPIISTSRTAAPDLIRHGVEGFIVEPGNATELAAYIETFLRSPEKIRSMGDAALRRAEVFTWKRFRDTIASVVGNIVLGRTEQSIQEICFQL
jgi:glycosyltransferase involved in cell wall biosynthesis